MARNIRVWPHPIMDGEILNCSSCYDDESLMGLIKYGQNCLHCSHEGCGYSSTRRDFDHRFLKAKRVCGKPTDSQFMCERCDVTEVEHGHCDKCTFVGDLDYHKHCGVLDCNNVVDSVDNYDITRKQGKCHDQRCDKCRIRESGYNFNGTLSEGHGSYYESEDNWFEGMWRKGKLVSGSGLIITKNGGFTGTWKQGVWWNGSGRHNGRDCYFEGEWCNGIKWTGKGYLKLASGREVHGIWTASVFESCQPDQTGRSKCEL